MANIILGISGSIAAYRAADLARDLMRAGHSVRCCLTHYATNFVNPILFETLTGNPCLVDTFQEPVPGRMAHIDWARNADLILIAPASANTINQIANGLATNMISTIALATTKQMVIAPAMNPAMYTDPSTQASLKLLASRGHFVIEPTEGDVACGENGQGKLAQNATILREVQQILESNQSLKGQTVLITTGPTQEPIDDVRFITNRSSGKMGHALALAAHWMGAEVQMVSGPTALPDLTFAKTIRVTTADQMLAAAQELAPSANLIIGAAAVADYKVNNPSSGKLRRSSESLNLELIPNPDIIATLAAQNPRAKVVAFAAEPDSDLSTAKAKLKKKSVAAIAINDISRPEIGFDSDQNELTLITQSGKTASSGLRSKIGCALWLLEQLAQD